MYNQAAILFWNEQDIQIDVHITKTYLNYAIHHTLVLTPLDHVYLIDWNLSILDTWDFTE